MDRDYTKATEEELCTCINDINNHYIEFDWSGQSSYSSTSYYDMYSSYISEDTEYYTSLYNATITCFCGVRQFDYSFYGTVIMDGKLEQFKTKLKNVRDCLIVPALGDTATEINYNIGRYGDTLISESIIGSDYVSAMMNNGLEEIVLSSQSPAVSSYLYNRIFSLSSDGTVTYDMEIILDTLSRSVDKITDAEYEAIAEAYLYMNEEDMSKLIQACTTKVEDVKYGFNIGPLAGLLNEDYSKWELNEDKYNKIISELDAISEKNLYAIYTNDVMYKKSDEDRFVEKARDLSLYRMDITQKIALVKTLENIDCFHGQYMSNYPDITIIAELNKINDESNTERTYTLEYKEFKNIGSDIAPVFSNFGNSKIIVGPCMESTENDFEQIEDTYTVLNNNFARGFTSDSFVDNQAQTAFVLEHILGFGIDVTSNYIYDNLPWCVETFISAVSGATFDYFEGINNASIIEVETAKLTNSKVYSIFDSNAVKIIYDTADKEQSEMYMTAGRYTIQAINAYNMYYPETPVSLEIFDNNFDKVVQDVLEHKKRTNAYLLDEVTRAGGEN